MTRKVLGAILFALLGICHSARADVVLHEFRPGERARAADVNDNFNNLKLAVEAAQQENAALREQLEDLQAALATVIALEDTLSVESVNGVRTVRFTGVNLQVVNGTNNTESVNGTGNLIIGYDEANTATRIVCSLATDANGGSLTNPTECLAAGGTVVAPRKTGSHNLVMGSQNSYSSAGGIVAGRGNYVTALYASNLGGSENLASGRFSVNVAGQGNHSVESGAAILGGANNLASGSNSTVTGGIRNESSGPFSHVSGGGNNNSSGATSTIAGGSANDSQAPTSSISGGSRNITTGVTQVLP